MKLALLTNNENIELFEELKREFITDAYEQYVRFIMFDICQELQTDMSTMMDSDFHKELRQTVIVIINKVWLDNVMKYITHSGIHTFMMLVERQMLGQDMFVNLFYARQISDLLAKYFNVTPEELDSVTDILTNRLAWVIGNMYSGNSNRYNEVLVRVMNNIYLIVANIRFKYYKFELDQYFRPLLLYTEKEPNEAFCS